MEPSSIEKVVDAEMHLSARANGWATANGQLLSDVAIDTKQCLNLNVSLSCDRDGGVEVGLPCSAHVLRYGICPPPVRLCP